MLNKLEPSFNLLSIICLIGVAQAFFYAIVLLFIKKQRNNAQLLLALFLLFYSLVQIGFILEESKYVILLPHLSEVFSALVLTLGPLIYLYVRALTKRGFKIVSVHLIHFIPYIILVALQIPYFSIDANEKINLIQKAYIKPDQDIIIVYIVYLQVFGYLFISIKNIKKYSEDIKDYFSNTDKLSLTWMIFLLISLMLIWIAWGLSIAFPLLPFQYVESILFTLFIYVLGFKGIKHPDLFIIETKVNPQEPNVLLPNKKYVKSGIAKNSIESSIELLKKSMENDGLYKDNELTLSKLAEQISIPSHHLSQLLNEHLKTNFYDYINWYRIEDVKIALLDTAKNNLTILAIAFDAGFSSKASFNKAFKKHTGTSPSAYKRNHSLQKHQNLS